MQVNIILFSEKGQGLFIRINMVNVHIKEEVFTHLIKLP